MRIRVLLITGLGLVSTWALAAVLLDRAPPPAGPPLVCPVLALRVASADRIELVKDRQAFWLERRGQTWNLVRQGGYPVRRGMADLLLSAAMTARLIKPVTGAAGLGDPFSAVDETGTLVRVLADSGAVLCALILGPPPAPVLRRQGEPAAWVADTLIPALANPRAWRQTALPPFEPDRVLSLRDSAGPEQAALLPVLAAGLPFDDADAGPRHHVPALRTVEVATNAGTAVLSTGREGRQVWLSVTGSSVWAGKLAAYAFALPDNSPLAPP